MSAQQAPKHVDPTPVGTRSGRTVSDVVGAIAALKRAADASPNPCEAILEIQRLERDLLWAPAGGGIKTRPSGVTDGSCIGACRGVGKPCSGLVALLQNAERGEDWAYNLADLSGECDDDGDEEDPDSVDDDDLEDL